MTSTGPSCGRPGRRAGRRTCGSVRGCRGRAPTSKLAQAVADEGGPDTFDSLLATDDEYLVFCGVLGLGRLLAAGPPARTRTRIEARLHEHATDPRWRVREAVALALQRLGDADLPRLFDLGTAWVGDPHRWSGGRPSRPCANRAC
ncbi:hypothetical protein TPA0907_02920 [Micromonospora humidisoli]|uniref:hypothetical protein n=1 Tax=Micromonospora sp. AKA109 TaxID=2733865 RepID=UPI0022C6812A|nr:hypothetical protein [Micromonospora sp. AKA109]GHJ05925.1 hypothetical protein TPA0907_02920 [Micromonospora sp. AKA109]